MGGRWVRQWRGRRRKSGLMRRYREVGIHDYEMECSCARCHDAYPRKNPKATKLARHRGKQKLRREIDKDMGE